LQLVKQQFFKTKHLSTKYLSTKYLSTKHLPKTYLVEACLSENYLSDFFLSVSFGASPIIDLAGHTLNTGQLLQLDTTAIGHRVIISSSSLIFVILFSIISYLGPIYSRSVTAA